MTLNWIDTSRLSFNYLLLLERVQLSWFPGWVPEPEMALALQANPTVAWYLRHKCPQITPWLDQICASHRTQEEVANLNPEEVYNAEQSVLQAINDLLVYAIDPTIYDNLPFLAWDDRELTDLVDFSGKMVIDLGSGTGRLAFIVAPFAKVVFTVEPVENLRNFLKAKRDTLGYQNLYPIDGLITEIPFPDEFADVTMAGHVFGDHPEEELGEMERVTKTGGMVILCPGTSEKEQRVHEYLVRQEYHWSLFEEPGDGWKRKYWKNLRGQSI